MRTCPYCQFTMKSGFIEGDGRNALIWVDANKKRGIADRVSNSNCILLDGDKLFRKTRVSAYYCSNCKKLIVDVDEKNIYL